MGNDNNNDLDEIVDYLETTDKRQVMDDDPGKYYDLRIKEQELVEYMLEEDGEQAAILMHVYLGQENYSAAKDLLDL